MSTDQHNVLDTSAIPQVGVESMNETHREEVNLVNHLGSLLDQNIQGHVDEIAITETLHAWVEHTRQHFSRENQLMQKYRFPALAVHSNEHSQVFARIEELEHQWHEKKRANLWSTLSTTFGPTGSLIMSEPWIRSRHGTVS